MILEAILFQVQSIIVPFSVTSELWTRLLGSIKEGHLIHTGVDRSARKGYDEPNLV